MQSNNPVFNEKTFDRYAYLTGTAPGERMTLRGTLNKAAVLLGACLLAAGISWGVVPTLGAAALPVVIGSALVAFVLAIVISFKQETAPGLSPVYAVAEGVFLGAFSAFLETRYPGIAVQAVLGTLGIFATMLVLYRAKVLRATPMFTKVVVGCTAAICLMYLVSLGFTLFGGRMPFLHDTGPIGIGLSLFILVIASLNFILDFDMIESGVEHGLPKHMEWYGGFALLVTLAWVYFEVLRLLRKLRE